MTNKIIYNMKRENIKKKLTSNLGKVIEEDDKLICYVDKRKLKKEQGKYFLRCWGTKLGTKKEKKYYDLDKQIIYIIDGIDFKFNSVYFFGDKDSEIIIRNCNFDLDLYVNTEGNCILDNIHSVSTYFSHIYAKKLIINNSKMLIRKMTNNSHILGISALDKLEINNSIIGDKIVDIYVSSSNKIDINSTEINASDLTFKAKRMIVDKKSKILASKKIDLEVHDFYDLIVSSPIINCNGTTYDNLNNIIKIKNKANCLSENKVDILSNKRLELINILKSIKSEVIISNEDNLKVYKEELNRKPISKILSR